MAKSERIEARHFFGVETFSGFIVGVFVVIVGLSIYIIFSPVYPNQKSLEFKKYLFYTAASRLNELNEDSDPTNVNMAMFTANFLKKELKNGNTVEQIVSEEMKVRALLDNISDSSQREKTASFLTTQGTSQNILLLARNNEWKKFRENPENVKILNELFFGNGKIPEIIYPKHNTALIFLIAISIIQISTFIGYLERTGERRYHYVKFYELQWGNVGTYVVILLLSPGMWVIVIPWAFWNLLFLDIGKFIRVAKEKKQAKKDLERRTMEENFDPAVIRGKFSSHRKESEALLRKLESRIQKERGAV